jgi:bifunctional non-homologous end joining protein LigD
MLAKPGPIPTRRGWLYEPKLDGFRCLVCTHDGRFYARSRQRWDMTPLLPELADAIPPDVQLDGELIAPDADGLPDFHRLCERMLHRDMSIPVTLFVFDVLAVEGLPTTNQPYARRRAVLESLELQGPRVRRVATYEDGEELFDVMCERGLEGVVAKRLRDTYRAGERLWVKTKNKATARFEEELAGATGDRRRSTSRARGSLLQLR